MMDTFIILVMAMIFQEYIDVKAYHIVHFKDI